MFGDCDAFFDKIRQEREQQKQEFRKLLDDCSDKVPEVGNRVVVAVGLLGHGMPWVRQEADVIEVGEMSYKIRFTTHPKQIIWEYWIHPALVTDVLPREQAVVT